MEKITLDELKRLQIKILDHVTSFCDEHDIAYWIDAGTLLGAVRHHGYIPWDDDIDIGMLRKDYEKFKQLYNQSSTRYQFYCNELDSKFYYAYGKVLDNQTVLYEPNPSGEKIAVNIDVFVYDVVTTDRKKLEKTFSKKDRCSYFNYFKHYYQSKEDKTSKPMKKMYRVFLKAILYLFPGNYFVKKIIQNAQTYQDLHTDKIANLSVGANVVYDIKYLTSRVKLKFEGKEYYAPICYDEWLTTRYGNYLCLPKEEERISSHKFEAYFLDK